MEGLERIEERSVIVIFEKLMLHASGQVRAALWTTKHRATRNFTPVELMRARGAIPTHGITLREQNRRKLGCPTCNQFFRDGLRKAARTSLAMERARVAGEFCSTDRTEPEFGA